MVRRISRRNGRPPPTKTNEESKDAAAAIGAAAIRSALELEEAFRKVGKTMGRTIVEMEEYIHGDKDDWQQRRKEDRIRRRVKRGKAHRNEVEQLRRRGKG